jgi:hypothetical protein
MTGRVNRRPKTMNLVRIRILFAATAGLFFAAAGWGAQYVRGQVIHEVRLKNGTVLANVTVVAVGSTTVVARWDGGMGTLLLTQLPEAMRTDLVAAAAAAKPAAPAAPPVAAPAAIDPNLANQDLPTDIKLTNGFVMHKSSVTRWDKTSVLIAYQGGIVSVRFQNIVPEQRAIFEARKDDELTRQAREDRRSTAGQNTADHDDQARQAAEAAAKEEEEKKAEEIRNGLEFHYLVKGMTKEQVIAAFGRPPDASGDTFFYVLRGHDKYGNAADRMLVFKDGILVSWRDQRDGEPAGAVDH